MHQTEAQIAVHSTYFVALEAHSDVKEAGASILVVGDSCDSAVAPVFAPRILLAAEVEEEAPSRKNREESGSVDMDRSKKCDTVAVQSDCPYSGAPAAHSGLRRHDQAAGLFVRPHWEDEEAEEVWNHGSEVLDPGYIEPPMLMYRTEEDTGWWEEERAQAPRQAQQGEEARRHSKRLGKATLVTALKAWDLSILAGAEVPAMEVAEDLEAGEAAVGSRTTDCVDSCLPIRGAQRQAWPLTALLDNELE